MEIITEFHAAQSENTAGLWFKSLSPETKQFLQQRLDCAERFVWMAGMSSSTAALIWLTGVFINQQVK